MSLACEPRLGSIAPDGICGREEDPSMAPPGMPLLEALELC
jgi:hypothetical protein